MCSMQALYADYSWIRYIEIRLKTISLLLTIFPQTIVDYCEMFSGDHYVNMYSKRGSNSTANQTYSNPHSAIKVVSPRERNSDRSHTSPNMLAYPANPRYYNTNFQTLTQDAMLSPHLQRVPGSMDVFPPHSVTYIPLQQSNPMLTHSEILQYGDFIDKAPAQLSSYYQQDATQDFLKQQIRANILEQLTPQPKEQTVYLNMYEEYPDRNHANKLSHTQSSSEAKKTIKRPSSIEENVGGKKQRFGDNRLGRKSPRPSCSSRSPPSNTRGGYHDGGANFIPDDQLRRTLSSKDPCEKLSRAIINYFLENQQTNAVYESKMKLRDALFSIVQAVFPHSGLYIVGSSMSGFGTKKSDMDLCLMISQQGIDQKKEATDLLYALQRSLRKCSFVKNLEVIRAKVPILRFRDKISGIECDLNVNNLVGIRNTHLLKHYALMDWRVRPLGLFIKYWARSQNINDARNMTISSYSFALMMIHYLQCGCTPPVLSTLQTKYPNEFSSSTDVRTLKPVTFKHHSPNTLSVGELFLGFLEYFSFTFDYQQDAISVRQGKTLPIREVQRKTADHGRQWRCLCIEEPFDMTNTARSVFNQDIFKRVHNAFRLSYLKLNKGKDVREIITKNT